MLYVLAAVALAFISNFFSTCLGNVLREDCKGSAVTITVIVIMLLTLASVYVATWA